MKILHVADLHLGRQFNGISLETDHQVVLDQMIDVLVAREVEVLAIAGDIFDRAAAPATAVRQFNAFLSRVVAETKAAVVMIAGNHDSGDRIAAMSIMTDRTRALIRGNILAEEHPLLLHDTHGTVAFTGLPFSYEYAARECFIDETLSTPEDVLKAQMAVARRNIPNSARWIVLAHAFVAGAEPSEAERPLARVGGIETVSASIFEGASYVALGHLHRPQFVGASHIRYSGSPLAFGFDEVDHEKSMSLVVVDGVGHIEVEEIAFKPKRRVRLLKGKHADLLAAEPSDDFVKAVLTDEIPIIEAMKRLRTVFPNACSLAYSRNERAPETKAARADEIRGIEPMQLVSTFVDHVRDEPMTEAERIIIAEAIVETRREEDAA
jgi:exonuclease SbcD